MSDKGDNAFNVCLDPVFSTSTVRRATDFREATFTDSVFDKIVSWPCFKCPALVSWHVFYSVISCCCLALCICPGCNACRSYELVNKTDNPRLGCSACIACCICSWQPGEEFSTGTAREFVGSGEFVKPILDFIDEEEVIIFNNVGPVIPRDFVKERADAEVAAREARAAAYNAAM